LRSTARQNPKGNLRGIEERPIFSKTKPGAGLRCVSCVAPYIVHNTML